MPTQPGIELTQTEQGKLQQLLKRRNEGATAMRAAAVLLSGSGMNCRDIARILGVTDREVRKCRQRWREGGIGGIQDYPRSGRPVLADAEFVRLLLRTAKRDPRKMGYVFSRWTTPRLSTFMAERTGVRLNPHHIGDLLRMHHYT